MGTFDELAQAEEDMKEVGDTPPEITQEVVPTEEASEEAGQFQVQDENTSGGLGERTVEEEEAPFTIDDVLGLGSKPEAPAIEEEQPAEEKAGEPEAPPTGTEARLSEMSERMRNTEEQNRLLTEKLLQLNAPAGEPDGQVVDELDADVKDYMRPYIEAELGSRMKAMEESMAPMRKASENEALASQIAIHVEGFTAGDLPKLQAAFDAVPQEQQSLYEGSVAGATLLAQKLASEGSFGKTSKKRTPNPMAARHQTESGSGVAGHGSGESSEEDQIRRINNLSDDQMLDILNRLSHG